MFDFGGRERFCESVCDHIVNRAVDKFDVALIDSIANEVVVDIYVLGASVVLVVFGERNG